MTATELQIERLNAGKLAITYEMAVVPPDRQPVTGEVRYIIPLAPSSAEPLAAMVPLRPVRIIWTGKHWVRIDSEIVK